MSEKNVTGRFRDIEIEFSIEGSCTYMSVRNLINDERQVRLMYQKLAMSGLANWRQFQLTSTPVLLRLPAEVLEAYRLTFFIDNAEPISARISKIVRELDQLRTKLATEDLEDDLSNVDVPTNPESETIQHLQKKGVSPKPKTIEEHLEKAVAPPAPEPIAEPVNPSDFEADTVEPEQPILSEKEQDLTEKSSPIRIIPKLPAGTVDPNLEFKIKISSLPVSALAKQQKSQATTEPNVGNTDSKQNGKGIFGQFAQALRLSVNGKRGKAYYQARSEAIQNEFQDKLSKLERDYNEGYGLNLTHWDMEALCEEEMAILLLNLMVAEVIAWQKNVGRSTPEAKQLGKILTEVSMRLRQTLKQTRGISTPAPTLFPDLLAENARDLEKIQSECDAYLRRFTKKLTDQEKKHAAKIEVIVFRKFLIEFVRDFIFVEIAKNTNGNALPKRLTWFLDLVDSEVIPIEIGTTKVSANHHKVKGACASEFESGTIVEVVTPGLQSKDGKRVSQMAVVIEAE